MIDISSGPRIGVDVGGTFTDCMVLDGHGHRLTTKASTTPSDPVQGVLASLKLAAEQLGVSLSELLAATRSFVHGTTMATNILVERRGTRTGLLMTRGHEQTLTIGRVNQKVAGRSEREKTHLTHLAKADPPIVQPEDVRPVTERLDKRGAVVAPLDLAEAAAMVDELVESGVGALAICLLWSFVNPRHEALLRQMVQERHPSLFVSVSSEVAPVLGEYERCVSTALNAYLGPRIGAYMSRLEGALREHGLRCRLLIMQADGGVAPVEAIRPRPILTLDSGPAGGVLGAQAQASLVGERNVICADVGGTTFDVGLIFDGRAEMDPRPVIDRYEYLMPKIYVKSIGAGGGSIAWRDRAGSLRVGPQSAGAEPGPACYGRGGRQPTLTDAQLVLGHLDPERLLAGSIRPDVAAAEAALDGLARELSLSPLELASGIVRIATSHAADLVRKVTVERGLDPRGFALLAYGGAGPMLGAFIAAHVGARVVYVPPDSGVFSALGMLTTDITFRAARNRVMRLPLQAAELESVNETFRSLDRQVLDQFERQEIDVRDVELSHSAQMRFRMQVHELAVDVPLGDMGETASASLLEAFTLKYESFYGPNSAYTQAGAELVTLACVGRTRTDELRLRAPTGVERRSGAGVTERAVHFVGVSGALPTPVFEAADLTPGRVFEGPAVVERMGDTIVIPPGWKGVVDDFGVLAMRPAGSAA